jgi:hypothetical protein
VARKECLEKQCGLVLVADFELQNAHGPGDAGRSEQFHLCRKSLSFKGSELFVELAETPDRAGPGFFQGDQGLSRKLRGHFAYYGITGNGRALSRFRKQVVETWFKWLNRRGGQHRWTWERYARVLRVVPLPEAIVIHSVLRHAARP